MRLITWLAFAAIAYTYLGYPLLIWILARICPRPWTVAPVAPSISIVMAVHNGAALLKNKLEHLLRLDYPHIEEIIVVSDGSTDGTSEILQSVHEPAIRPILLNEHQGKAAAINTGVSMASSELVLFTDIRPWIAPGAIQALVSNFADPRVGCAAGELFLDRDSRDATTRAVSGLYWRHEQWLRKCESAFDSPVGVYGGFYAVRRHLIVPQPEGMILDDMFQPLSIIRQGYRSVLDPRAKVYDTWPKQINDEFHRKVRTLAGNYQLLQVMPWTLSPRNRVFFQFLSHKVMRLIAPYFFVILLWASVMLSFHSPFYAVFALFQIVGWMGALASLAFHVPLLQRIMSPISALLVLNAAAVVGLYRFFTTRGPLWKIWNAGHLSPKA